MSTRRTVSTITLDSPIHGTFKTTDDALFRVMSRYPMGETTYDFLLNLVEEIARFDEFESYADLDTMGLYIMLASFDVDF